MDSSSLLKYLDRRNTGPPAGLQKDNAVNQPVQLAHWLRRLRDQPFEARRNRKSRLGADREQLKGNTGFLMGTAHSSTATYPDGAIMKNPGFSSKLSKMGYDNLPLEIELKILDDIEWTESVACSQVCTRWRDHLAAAKVLNRRYLPDRHSGGSGISGLKQPKGWGSPLQGIDVALSDLAVSIATDEAPPGGYDETDDGINTGVMPQSAILGRGSAVLLHRFMHGSEHSFGFYVKVDPTSLSPDARSWDNPPEGFFLIGNEKLHQQANSLYGRPGRLIQAPSGHDAETASTSESSTIDSEEDEKDGESFSGRGRAAVQLNTQWQWSESIFNSPICETEITYGLGFETFRRIRRNTPYNPRAGGSSIGGGSYLRRLSELRSAGGSEKDVTIRRLVDAITKSVRTVKMLEPEVKERGGMFFVKFRGIHIQEHMKYVPHGFFDFQTGGGMV
ncbi:hypothetical protein DRE_00243 [Drechslerella stenobrocha 248]|uniref:F-box domain-containing protein n=1 Tax=Drechslerella stenobrocha 248 TaxID=1043628 RepID=W7I9D7_9PEZI|nr:hypothetical protein DRE_00243 [Drechslerella stenobrocha 248]